MTELTQDIIMQALARVVDPQKKQNLILWSAEVTTMFL